MDKAAFSFEKYLFSKVSIDLEKNENNEIEVSFIPQGLFNKEDSSFELTLHFSAFNPDSANSPFVSIDCKATFQFVNVTTKEDIPSFFYRNGIAIVFPYLRAFISMVTLQANIPPLILPTMNLSALEEPFRAGTTEK